MSNILGNMPPVFGSGYRGVVPAPTASDVSSQNVLRADGSWGAQATSGPLPSQTGNAGKLLTTDGTNASWSALLNTFAFGDVTLGTGGPSVKSSIGARAARQGLVFDGSSVVGASATLSTTIGTSDFSTHTIFTVPTANPSDATTVFNICAAGGFLSTGRAFNAYITPTGLLVVRINGATSSDFRYAAINTNAVSTYGGKLIALSTVRSGSTLSVYINGVSAAYTETTGGTVPAWSDTVNGAFCFVGSSGGDRPLTGTIFGPYIYNRALSASEVVSLFEAGVPKAGDYNTASNTAVYSTDFSTSTGWNLGTGTTISGGKLNFSTGNYAQAPVSTACITGKRYRITGTVVLTSGANLAYFDGVNYQTITNSSGSFSFEFTAAAASPYGLYLNSYGGTGATLDDFAFYNVGLLLAPDAGQAGGGLAWYDTSGNAANITLPASGVSWNVPSSQKTASGWTFGGNLNVRSALGYATGVQSGTTSDSTQQFILSSSGAYNHAYIGKNGTNLGIGFSSTNGSFTEDNAITIAAATKAVTLAGNLTVSGTGTSTFGGTLAVGNGTDTGNATMGVNGSSNVSNIYLARSDYSWGINNESDFRIYVKGGRTTAPGTGGTKVFEIINSGNVLIGGGADGGQKLQVSGTASIGNTGNSSTSNTLTLKGVAVSDGSGLYGSYGSMLLNSDAAFASSARPFLVTNAYNYSSFAIIRGTNATTPPTLGTNGAVTSGTVDFSIDNSGNATFAGTVKIKSTSEIKGVRTATATYDFGTIASGDASGVCSVTISGATSSDTVIVNCTDSDNFPQFCVVNAVPVNGSVSVRLYNPTASSKTIGSRTIRVTAIQF